MKSYKPPERPDVGDGRGWIFLAGAIDNGSADLWQARLEDELAESGYKFLNPRRDDWDPSWTAKVGNKDFEAQVNWELDYMEKAEIIIFYFPANCDAPITLLELGLHGTAAKAVVFCPDEYRRSGNVHIVAKRRGLALFKDHDEMVRALGGTPGPAQQP